MTSLGIVALANRVVTTDCDETRPGEPLWPLGHAAIRSFEPWPTRRVKQPRQDHY
jgi:hypothetical protein